MKKSLSMLALAALTIGLLGSCTRIDNLEKRIDTLENDKIASIDDQIASIQSSIKKLDQIDGLSKRADELEAFVKNDLASKEWVDATYASLEQFQITCDTVAKLKEKLGQTDEKIDECVESLKDWITSEFNDYYKIAEIEAKLKAFKDTTLADAIAAAKEELTAGYKAAIKAAIEAYDGYVTPEIKEAIDTLNGRVASLEASVTALTGRVSDLEKIVQSISFIPEYQGGAVIRIPFGKSFAGDWTLNYKVTGYDDSQTGIAQMIADAFKADREALTIDFRITEILPDTKATYAGDTLRIKTVTKKEGVDNVICVTVDSLSLYNTMVGHYIDSEDRGMSIRLRLRTGKTDILSDYTDVSIVRESLSYYASLLPYYLNFIYGTEEWYLLTELATDEMTWSTGANMEMRKIDANDSIPANAWPLEKVWNVAYSAINLSNLIINEGKKNGLDEAAIAEAKFYRAFWYFNLVRMFEGVPYVDKYAENIFDSLKVRQTADIIFRNVIDDADNAMNNLPDSPAIDGGASKTAARLLLGQTYISYAWWLENPNTIPTFPVVSRASANAAMYYKKAADVLKAVIEDNSDPYSLQDIHYNAYTNPLNDYNSEWIIYADHRHDAKALLLPSYGVKLGSPDNVTGRLMNWHWDRLRFDRKQVMFPAADIRYGYPRSLYAPTVEGLFGFNDTDIDSRWDATFNSELKGNWGSSATVEYDGFTFKNGENVILILPQYIDGSSVEYNTKVPMLGKLPGTDSYVLHINDSQRNCYPTLAKYNFKEGDNDRYSRRPSLVMSLGEAYLLHAEACVKLGNNDEAYKSVQVLRIRAGKWGDSEGSIEMDYSMEMADKTPSTIDMGYILDERLREFFGSGFRWFDLKRTQKWGERAGSYTITTFETGVMAKKAMRRDLLPYRFIRYVPQAQVDRTGIEQSPAE